MKTFTPTPADIENKRVPLDEAGLALGRLGQSRPSPRPPAEAETGGSRSRAGGVVRGRLASIVAMRLRGKHKPTFTPHMDMGDNVIVINADKVQITGDKRNEQVFWHTGYPGGIK